jgi:uncharacterized protein (TIGR02300 family)
MATKAERGTKRTCQNGSCGARFYDLNRAPITCPMCSSVFVPTAASIASAGEAEASRRSASKKSEFVAPASPSELPDAVVEGDDVLVEVEEAGEEVAAGDEETFLEAEEDEGGDVSGIIGGGSAEGDEES